MGAKTRILIIEDCPSDVVLVERMLCDGSYPNVDITDVPRLVDAFHKVENESFDVILLDLNLKDIDGVASVAALHAEVPETPIIIYSGMENKRLMEEALMCGACQYLVKGQNNPLTLQQSIREALVYNQLKFSLPTDNVI